MELEQFWKQDIRRKHLARMCKIKILEFWEDRRKEVSKCQFQINNYHIEHIIMNY
jgi:hypothetical protein